MSLLLNLHIVGENRALIYSKKTNLRWIVGFHITTENFGHVVIKREIVSDSGNKIK